MGIKNRLVYAESRSGKLTDQVDRSALPAAVVQVSRHPTHSGRLLTHQYTAICTSRAHTTHTHTHTHT